ncbi:hypothetical protein [Dyadobacter sp. LHD-138]|uniref:hypothetical protein n=1 Tax=Dyadobacter sp. LHD-138 TaxID=3071413 RepID=UPI0027E06EDE|nr:hypothetical protein [Dyadobacter sp. LHD-138]MDQ6479600.1 hypothetical protein [Dyadobacter sp. LHD-138]
MFKKLLFGICVCFVALLVSCKGDDGAVGPAGEKGAKGDTGAAGPAGQDGQGGGAAGIISVGSVTGTGTGDLSFGIDNLTAAQQALYDTSVVVMVYAKSLGAWWPLPGSVQFDGDKVSSYTFVHGVDKTSFFVEIIATGWSEDQAAPPSRKFDDIRIVLIPAASLKLSAEVNWKSYEETIKALGLTDRTVKKAFLFKRK